MTDVNNGVKAVEEKIIQKIIFLRNEKVIQLEADQPSLGTKAPHWLPMGLDIF